MAPTAQKDVTWGDSEGGDDVFKGILTSVHMMSPMKKETTDIPRISSSRRYPLLNVSGYMSTTAVTKLSTHTNCRRGDLIKALLVFAPLSSYLFFMCVYSIQINFKKKKKVLPKLAAKWNKPPTFLSTCSD